ncbi:MAG: DUF445 domain-containing protein [Beijerinckiaceae bacterium]
MTDTRHATASPQADLEAVQAAQLARIKGLATGMLVLALAVLIAAKALQHRHPGWGYVAAFAEAAAIGGLADWYAVVAIFRRPLGLPIPHTAIIPANQQRIGDNLGRFIERQFLRREAVEAKLREVDFAKVMADWLADHSRSAGLVDFIVRMLPRTLDAVQASELKGFVNRKMREQIDAVELAPLAAKILSAFTEDARHQRLLDQLMNALHGLLNDDATVMSIRDKIRDELPALFKIFRADAYVLKKIMNSAFAFIEDVRRTPDHPLRAEFDGFVANFIRNLRESPDYAARVEKLKEDLLARPEWAQMGRTMWEALKQYVEQDTGKPDSIIRQHLHALLVDLGRQLTSDEKLRSDMNAGFVTALMTFVETHKAGFATFIADQVKGWDMTQLVRLIELNIGRDLQYIRFNGMLIGGIAGLILHTVMVALKLD